MLLKVRVRLNQGHQRSQSCNEMSSGLVMGGLIPGEGKGRVDGREHRNHSDFKG